MDFAHLRLAAAHDLDGLGCFFDFLGVRSALEREKVAAALDKRQAIFAEDGQPCDGARDGEVKLLAVLLHACSLLCPRVDAGNAFEAELVDDGLQEIDALVQGIHERQLGIRAKNLERQARKAGACTDIDYRYRPVEQRRVVGRERIDHVLDRHLMRFRDGSEIHFLVPLHQQLIVARELRELRLTQRQAEGLRCFLHLISKHHRAPSQSFSFSSSWTSRSRFCCSSQTSNTETSAGETPLMRPAWPTERGRMAASFSRASSRRLGTS